MNMKIFSLPPFCQTIQTSALTIGNFDGFHQGHQQLIERLIVEAEKRQLTPTVMLFEPQPQEFFQQKTTPARLLRLTDKLRFLQKKAIPQVIVLPFNQRIADLSPEAFINLLRQDYQIKYLLVGDDFRFGCQRSGDFELLKQYHANGVFELEQLPSQQMGNERVSSTRIREALKSGDLVLAEQMLGRPFSITGKVVAGQKRGRLISFPTANIALLRKSIPLTGVYVVQVRGLSGNLLPAVANIGCRPTVDGSQYWLEVHLLDFSQDIYGKRITIEFLHKLRNEQKFSNIIELQEQITRDTIAARLYWQEVS